MHKVDNAIILAAGTSSRFAPLSYEFHKAFVEINGEKIIERQIIQLQEIGIKEIIIVTGYKDYTFEYLKEKYGIKLVHNNEYLIRNNHSSIYAVKDYLRNSYICSADNYFIKNPFSLYNEESNYSVIFKKGKTDEWCVYEDADGFINKVTIGGENAWCMMGAVFWSNEFSEKFLKILEQEYHEEKTKNKLWEQIYVENIDVLKMKTKKYDNNMIFEFDTLDELRQFDATYIKDTRSTILKNIAKQLNCQEEEIKGIKAIKDENNEAIGFSFNVKDEKYKYFYSQKVEGIKHVK